MKTSHYIGVFKKKGYDYYIAQIYISGTSFRLGQHESEKLCRDFYNYIKQYHKMNGDKKTIEYIRGDWKSFRDWIITGYFKNKYKQ